MPPPYPRSPGPCIVPLVCLVLLAGLPRVAGAEPADSGPASRIDPALATAARLTPRDSFTVWVGFRDKGEAGPADLAALLKAAEAALTPRARARRLRAGVQPLVDERDLPVAPGYLEALTRSGCRPSATSFAACSRCSTPRPSGWSTARGCWGVSPGTCPARTWERHTAPISRSRARRSTPPRPRRRCCTGRWGRSGPTAWAPM